MASWLEVSRSPEYSPAELSRLLSKIEHVIGLDELEEAMGHETIIVGGYINTNLIQAKSIVADQVKLEGLATVNGLFKILEDGSIEATDGRFSGVLNSTSGVIGGFNISEKGLTKSFTKTWGPFTQDDIDRVYNIILRFEELTQADLDKYDISGSGYLNLVDLLRIHKMMGGYDPYEVEYTTILNTEDMREMLVFQSSLGQTTRIGTFGIDAPTGRFENVIIDGYRLHVSSDGSVSASPDQ